MNVVVQVLVLGTMLGVPFVLAITFTFFPQKIVKAYGKTSQNIVKGKLQLTDEQIDKIPILPTDRVLMKSRSEFISKAGEHPEEFEAMIVVLRGIGILFWGITAVAVFAIMIIVPRLLIVP